VPDLPPEVRARLRKLEKLEKTYPELLRSYRIAHSRATSIEPFERALKENTPLTSIKDPEALIEYLNQVNLRNDMVMEELKRVTAEKDTYKRKADDAEKELVVLKEEVAALKAAKSPSTPGEHGKDSEATSAEASGTAEAQKSPVSRVLEVFSPKQKPSGPSTSQDGGDKEDFFSYDNEIPQLQAELSKKSEEVEKLQGEVRNLKDELSLVKEHSAGLVESLENATRELSETRDAAAVKASFETQLEARNTEISALTERLDKAHSKLRDVEAQLEEAKREAAEAAKDNAIRLTASISRNEELERELKSADQAKSALDKKIQGLASEIELLKKVNAEAESRVDELNRKIQPASTSTAAPTGVESTQESSPAAATASGSKKKNKKKKKGGSSAISASSEPTPSEASVAADQAPPSPLQGPTSGELQAELDRLLAELAEKNGRIESLSKQRKTEEELREEIENLQENLLTIGQDHVEARERIKELEAEKKALKERISELEKEVETAASATRNNSALQSEHESLKQEFDSLKMKSSTLQSDLAAAQQLAQTRYKDLTDLREVLQKAQPELKSLRQDSAALKTTREELAAKSTELRELEKREKDLKSELTRAQRLASDREAEIKSLHEKVAQETNARLRLEDEKRVAGRDLRRSEAEKIELSAREEKATRELQRVQEEAAAKLRPRIRELEDEAAKLKKEQDVLREEIEFKTNQYSNAQNLLSSMRDQTAELSIQLKESQSQCESLDEELAEARKMLGERTREAETMRRLLADVDERADNKVREMRAKMDAAIEERDRLEDESSALARRKARETEELRQKIRDLEREVKALATEKDDLEHKEREWRRRREELEAYEERAGAEVTEMRTTVTNLRSTLDASEQQVRDSEKKNAELRRALDDYRLRYDKLAKEAKALQAKLSSPAAVAVASSGRSSIDSTRSGGTSTMSGAGQGQGQGSGSGQDAMYLKTILLQFLEQKDNKLRAQLVPVLGKLLKFDK
jgi:chromosome segregation ATPase